MKKHNNHVASSWPLIILGLALAIINGILKGVVGYSSSTSRLR